MDVHILEKLGLKPKGDILLHAHIEENIDSEKNFSSLFAAINKMAQKYDMPVLYSCHPRCRESLEEGELDKSVIVHESLGFHDYNHLKINAFAVVSDSGTLPEESSFLTRLDIHLLLCTSELQQEDRKLWIPVFSSLLELMQSISFRRLIQQ